MCTAFSGVNARAAPRRGGAAAQLAATAEDGEFEFHYWDASFGNGGYLSRLHNQKHGHRYPLRVTGRNLERELRARIPDRLARLRLIKIDAEGYDAAVVSSMRGLIDEFRPVLICEVHKKLDAGERAQLRNELSRPRYRLHRYTGGGQPLAESMADDFSRWRTSTSLLFQGTRAMTTHRSDCTAAANSDEALAAPQARGEDRRMDHHRGGNGHGYPGVGAALDQSPHVGVHARATHAGHVHSFRARAHLPRLGGPRLYFA
jgi:FkbM family methyltransferase